MRFSLLGCEHTVHAGGLLGRMATAQLVVSDPRVSEAHALVSLRGRSLRLLALRGSLLVDGREVDAVELRPGLMVELAEALVLTVVAVELPTHALMLCGAAPDMTELMAAIYSLVADAAGVRLLVGYLDGAAAHLWWSGGRAWIRRDGAAPEPLTVGRLQVAGHALRVVRVPLGDTTETWAARGRRSPSLVLRAFYSSVHVQHADGTAVLTGKPANLVSELVRFGKPVPWDTLAREVWGADGERALLRKSFDSTMRRLRGQLQELDLRDDLVRLDGSGNVELVLHAGDQVFDET
ncbi:MAG: hypothetical protein JNL82_27790 [Myxococcales bacterium]|nr:hypothetical protein [Myxococcales bacterium]